MVVFAYVVFVFISVLILCSIHVFKLKVEAYISYKPYSL